MKTPLLALEFRLAEAVNHVAGAAVSVFNYCTARDAWAQYAAARRAVNEALPSATLSSSGMATLYSKIYSRTGSKGKAFVDLVEHVLAEEHVLAKELDSIRILAFEFPVYNAVFRYMTVLSIQAFAVLGNSIYTGFYPEQTGSVAGLVLGGAFGVMLAGCSAVKSMDCGRTSDKMLGLYNELRADLGACKELSKKFRAEKSAPA